MTDVSNTSAVRVPGAILQYEVTGTGPVLLLIHGGVADSSMLKEFAGRLADRRAVVTYDRRGYGDSPLEDTEQEQSVELHADDAHRLLSELTDEPADVLGLSSGAFIGIELAGRHPDQVRTLVAFEPPLVELLPDREWFHADGRETFEIYRRDGAGAALAKFSNMVQDGSEAEPAGAPSDPDPEMLEFMARMGRNAEFFFEHEYRQFGGWLPDLDALRSVPARMVIGGGEASGTQPARRAADAVAERLGVQVAEFPGDHGSGIMEQPDAFAMRLEEVLRG
jgi:pimeloyl-ACP methyl ester carboxylesterase